MKKNNFFFMLFMVLLLVSALTAGAYAAVLGDVDGDGKVAAADARLALRASVGLEKYAVGSEQFTAANVDFDAKISAADARLILRAAVGLEQFKQPEEPKPAHTHSFGAWQPEKNGTKLTGKHFRVCACGEKQTKECTFGSWTESSPATCTSAQLLSSTCSVCGGKQSKAGTAKLGHIKGARIDARSTAATCTARGSEVFHCTRCGKDYVEYTNALGHSFTKTGVKNSNTQVKAPTCTADGVYYYTCARCGLSAKGIDEAKRYTAENSALGHITQLAKSELGENVKLPVCPRCGKSLDTSIATFNQLVNRIKTLDRYAYDSTLHSYKYPVSYISKSTMTSTCENYSGFKSGITDYRAIIKELFEDEMTGEEVSYTALYEKQSPICIPIRTETNTVSSLENGDATIKAEIVKGLKLSDVFSGIPNDVTVGTKSYSTAAYKTKAVSGDVIKITVTLKDEKLFNDQKQLAAPIGTKTALAKLTGTDIRDELSGFDDNYTFTQEEGGDGAEMKMKMTLKQITSSGNATFWFDAETLAPLAIVYNTDMVMSQDIYIYIKIALVELDGTMAPVVDTKTKTVYVFPQYFN